jgi:hypothetical protein
MRNLVVDYAGLILVLPVIAPPCILLLIAYLARREGKPALTCAAFSIVILACAAISLRRSVFDGYAEFGSYAIFFDITWLAPLPIASYFIWRTARQFLSVRLRRSGRLVAISIVLLPLLSWALLFVWSYSYRA